MDNGSAKRWREIVAEQETQDNAALSYDALFLRRALWEHIGRGLPPGVSLIDIGANAGYARAWLGNKLQAYFGVEPSNLPLQRCSDLEIRARLVQGIGEALPARSGQFTAALMIEMLDHAIEPERVLREAQRVLAPGATAFVSVANCGTIVRGFYRWYERRRGRLAPGHDPHFDKHTFHFGRSEMREMLRRNGWRVVAEKGFGYLPLPRKLGSVVPERLLRVIWNAANWLGDALLPYRCDGSFFIIKKQ